MRKNFRPNRNGKPAVKQPPHRTEYSAGGVVFRRTEKGVLIGLIQDSYRKWTFPKGHVEPGETIAQTALRETTEEMGIRKLRIVAPLGRTSIWFKDRFEHVGVLVNKHITYFLMQAPSGAYGRPERPATGEGRRIFALRWVPYRQATRAVNYRNMSKIVANAVAYLERFEEGVPKHRQE